MSKRKHKDGKKENRFAMCVSTFFLFAIFGCTTVFYIIGWNNYLRTQNILKEEGISVQGEVVSLTVVRSHAKRSNGASVYPTVEFIDGNNVSHRFKSIYAYSCSKGDRLPVLYVASSPEIAAIETAGSDIYNIPFFLVIVSMMLFASFLFYSALFYRCPCSRQSSSPEK